MLLLLLKESRRWHVKDGQKILPAGVEIFQEAAPYYRCIAEVSATIFAAKSGMVKFLGGIPIESAGTVNTDVKARGALTTAD